MMKQEYKELLLRDLCARLPYGVECFVHGDCDSTLTSIVNDRCYFENLDWEIEEDDGYRDIDSGWVQPYLRKISSMTEEEKQELYSWGDYEMISWISDEEICLKDLTLSYELLTKLTDWLNANFFDYRGLIELGLALEAPEGMYK